MKTAEETMLKLCEQVDHWKGQAETYKKLYEDSIGLNNLDIKRCSAYSIGYMVGSKMIQEPSKEQIRDVAEEVAKNFKPSQMKWNEQEPKQKYSDEDWAKVPKEVRWLCTYDFVELWTEKPSPALGEWVNIEASLLDFGYMGDADYITPYSGDWKDSLEERPQHLR